MVYSQDISHFSPHHQVGGLKWKHEICLEQVGKFIFPLYQLNSGMCRQYTTTKCRSGFVHDNAVYLGNNLTPRLALILKFKSYNNSGSKSPGDSTPDTYLNYSFVILQKFQWYVVLLKADSSLTSAQTQLPAECLVQITLT